jgi:hypothetical protein
MSTPSTSPEWKNKRRREILAADEQVGPIHRCFLKAKFLESGIGTQRVPDWIQL